MGKKNNSMIGKLMSTPLFLIKGLKIAKKFKPDFILSHGSHIAAHVSFLIRKPHIAFEDTYNKEQIWLYKPFTKAIFTSDYNHPLKSKKIIRYPGYHELAYLHPNTFKANPEILKELKIIKNEIFTIIRFVSWKASHDIGQKGMSYDSKIKAVKEFSKYGKVFISSESDLPPDLNEYQIQIKPHQMHQAIAFASLMFGESSTMAEEAAMLGVPSIYVSSKSTWYTKHLQEKYNLVFNYSADFENSNAAIQKAIEILQLHPKHQEYSASQKNKMLDERIDVTDFMISIIENYPESIINLKQANLVSQKKITS